MLSYEIRDSLVEFTLAGRYGAADLGMLFEAARGDPRLPTPAFALIDARAVEWLPTDTEVREQLGLFLLMLGRHVSPALAVISTARLNAALRTGQIDGNRWGLRVGIFKDTVSARSWLNGYASERRSAV